MILKSVIQEVIEAQRINIGRKGLGLIRQTGWEVPQTRSHALILTGIRRCGKSTLLHQMMDQMTGKHLYLNFDDPRLFGFSLNDFERIREIIAENRYENLFLDEIQLVGNWERFVRQLTDLQQYRIILTGSNAGMLSREMGTHLTGRHISKELFPFSFKEFTLYRDIPASPETTETYLQTGGFPEFIKSENSDILNALLKDILYRDISVQYGVRNHEAIEMLVLHLFSNLTKPVTSNSLRKLLEIGAASTVSEYLYFLDQTYLFSFVRKFSYSYKQQVHNPRKPYAVDPGLARHNSVSFTRDLGRYLENAVFLHLRRKGTEIYYFSEQGECDFVVMDKGKPRQLIQVCHQLTADNLSRELKGLQEAMHFFKLGEGQIITVNQEDTIQEKGMLIEVKPFHKL